MRYVIVLLLFFSTQSQAFFTNLAEKTNINEAQKMVRIYCKGDREKCKKLFQDAESSRYKNIAQLYIACAYDTMHKEFDRLRNFGNKGVIRNFGNTANIPTVQEADLKDFLYASRADGLLCRMLEDVFPSEEYEARQAKALSIVHEAANQGYVCAKIAQICGEGVYNKENPTLQTYQYIVVVTKQGHFIIPGLGVSLPNGKTVGKDIIIDKNTNLQDMIKPGGALSYNKKPLAARLKLHASLTERILSEKMLDVEE